MSVYRLAVSDSDSSVDIDEGEGDSRTERGI